jgi:hypothetical protein
MNWRNGHSQRVSRRAATLKTAREGNTLSKLHFGSTVTTEPSSRKTAQRCGLTSITVIACDSFEVQKGSQLFLRTHNETLSVVAMRVSNPDRSPA